MIVQHLMTHYRIPRTIAEDIVYLSPIAFVRTNAAEKDIRFSDKFIFFKGDGTVVRKGRFSENDVCQIASQYIREFSEHAAFKIACKTCSESDAVQFFDRVSASGNMGGFTVGLTPIWLEPPTKVGRERAGPLIRGS